MAVLQYIGLQFINEHKYQMTYTSILISDKNACVSACWLAEFLHHGADECTRGVLMCWSRDTGIEHQAWMETILSVQQGRLQLRRCNDYMDTADHCSLAHVMYFVFRQHLRDSHQFLDEWLYNHAQDTTR